MVYKVFDKQISGISIKNKDISNKELAEELHKLITRKFKKKKLHSLFIDNKEVNLIKDLDFCYVLLTFIGNMQKL